MADWLGLVALIALGGAAVTVIAAVVARALTEERRLQRVFRKGLGAAPDASLVAAGFGRGAALSLTTRRLTTVWDGGRWRLDYGLDEVLGAELELDGEIAARAVRGEERRRLERSSSAEREVLLRLLFDDPQHPDFELQLWPAKARRPRDSGPRAAVSEANRWIGRIEAVLRRTGAARVAARARARDRGRDVHRSLEDDLYDDEDTFAD
jgi:hypothetical protein